MPKKGTKANQEQQFIPGTEPPRIKAIDSAAEKYVNLRDDRTQMAEVEADAREKLRELMVKHELTEYRTPSGYKVVREAGEEKVKVRRAATEEVPA